MGGGSGVRGAMSNIGIFFFGKSTELERGLERKCEAARVGVESRRWFRKAPIFSDGIYGIILENSQRKLKKYS